MQTIFERDIYTINKNGDGFELIAESFLGKSVILKYNNRDAAVNAANYFINKMWLPPWVKPYVSVVAHNSRFIAVGAPIIKCLLALEEIKFTWLKNDYCKPNQADYLIIEPTQKRYGYAKSDRISTVHFEESINDPLITIFDLCWEWQSSANMAQTPYEINPDTP